MTMARRYSRYNKIPTEREAHENRFSLDICRDTFYKAIQNKSSSLYNQQNIIVSGRKYANMLFDVYSKLPEANLLLSILDAYQHILPYYPRGAFGEEISKTEIHLIQDKCKYFVQSMLVMFHLNMMDALNTELMAFKNHLHIFGRYIRCEFKELYKNIKELYHSFTYVSIYNENKRPVNIYNRIGHQPYELVHEFQSEGARLHRAVIVGSCATQVALDDMTIDMFRMSQATETKVGKTVYQKNARKWLFYNRSFIDVETSINDAYHNISKRGILLLYISGDRYEKKNVSVKIENSLYHSGIKMKQEADENIVHSKIECFYPADVANLLADPTILIIDSGCSESFQELHRRTHAPFISLLSPAMYPDFIELSNCGKLFTLFLTSPQTAFCWICHKRRVDSASWKELVNILNDFMLELSTVVAKLFRKFANDKLRFFMGDSFCRAFLMRYLFCMVTLRLHNEFSDERYYPRSNLTKLEPEILSNKKLQSFVYSMASVIDSPHCFVTSSDLSITNESIDVEI